MVERIRKKYNMPVLAVELNQPTDITELAVRRYEELKKNYSFVSF